MDKIKLLIIACLYFPTVSCVRCYQCEYRRCPAMSNCKEPRDVCTINNFNRWEVRQVECPGLCETHLTTDPNGRVIQWHRGCSVEQLPPRGSPVNICHTSYRAGIKEDICTCSADLCNGSVDQRISLITLSMSMIIFFILYSRKHFF